MPDPLIPDTTISYQTKDALRTFCLRERDLDDVPYTSQRNFSGPYPIRQYKGSDLLVAAKNKYAWSDHCDKRIEWLRMADDMCVCI